jgi:hypothetical protein
MFNELPLFLMTWAVGLSIILLPSLITLLFGKEEEE